MFKNNLKENQIILDILTTIPDYNQGNSYDCTELYGECPKAEEGIYTWKSEKTEGYIKYPSFIWREPDENDKFPNHHISSTFKISYVTRTPKNSGDKPIVFFLHGVPTNKYQYSEIQKYISRFLPTIAIDMLGMGASSKPLNYRDINTGEISWLWKYDCIYIKELIDNLYPDRKWILVADDWGGGIALTCSTYQGFTKNLLHMFLLDPISFDGYPVNEIQAIGRASSYDFQNKKYLEDEDRNVWKFNFELLMSAFDQTVVQILKTMVHDSSKFDQFKLKSYMYPYIETDYTGKYKLNSKTMTLDYNSIEVLADRASILSPSLLLPKTDKNSDGIDFSEVNINMTIIWGKQDNMMPSKQLWYFKYAFPQVKISGHFVENAGHFVGVDQPEIVSEIILDHITEYFGIKTLIKPFFGFGGIYKGSEKEMSGKIMKELY